jgi:hypothetical protein
MNSQNQAPPQIEPRITRMHTDEEKAYFTFSVFIRDIRVIRGSIFSGGGGDPCGEANIRLQKKPAR